MQLFRKITRLRCLPFLVCWPAQLKPGESQAVVNSLDILPTALAAAGLPASTDKSLDGLNLLSILRGETPAPVRNLFWCSGSEEGWWAVRSGDWKLVAQRDKVELFDLAKDISEKTDLAKTMPDTLAELTKQHDDWLAQMANPVKAGEKKWTPGMSPVAKKKKLTAEEKQKARDEERAKKKAQQ